MSVEWKPIGHKGWASVAIDAPNFCLKVNNHSSHVYTDFGDATDYTANLLLSEWNNKPLYLALSGGLDSECVANSLVRNRIPFTPVILKIGDVNRLETWYAEYWCYANNITPLVIEYTSNSFAAKCRQFAKKSIHLRNFFQTAVYILYEKVEQLGGYCINAAGDINLDSETGKFYCQSLDFASDLLGYNHPSSFFMYTPEIALSYINQFNEKLGEQYNKLRFYGVTPRPKIDYVFPLHFGQQSVKDTVYSIAGLAKIDPLSYCRFWYGSKQDVVNLIQGT